MPPLCVVQCAAFLPGLALAEWLEANLQSRLHLATWLLHEHCNSMRNFGIPSHGVLRGASRPTDNACQISVGLRDSEIACVSSLLTKFAGTDANALLSANGAEWFQMLLALPTVQFVSWSPRFGALSAWVAELLAHWIIPPTLLLQVTHASSAECEVVTSISLRNPPPISSVVSDEHTQCPPETRTVIIDQREPATGCAIEDLNWRACAGHEATCEVIATDIQHVFTITLGGVEELRLRNCRWGANIVASNVASLRRFEVESGSTALSFNFIAGPRVQPIELQWDHCEPTLRSLGPLCIEGVDRITVPGSVDEMHGDSVCDCGSLTALDFSRCVNLTTLRGVKRCDQITTMTSNWPPHLERISNALCGMDNLTAVDLSSCRELVVMDSSFVFCPLLLKVTLSPSLTHIVHSFAQCGMVEIDFRPCESLHEVTASFVDCHVLSELQLPPSISQLGEGVFSRTYLQSLDLSRCHNLMSVDACWSCLNLRNVTLPCNTSFVADGAFRCSGFVAVDFSRCTELQYIGVGAFADCSALQHIIWPATAPNVGQLTVLGFSGAMIETVTLPSWVCALSITSFADCRELRFADLSETSLTVVSGFTGCTKLERVSMPETVIEIAEFNHLDALEELNLERCNDLRVVTGFQNSVLLSRITLPVFLERIGPTAFSRCAITELDLTHCARLEEVHGFAECASLRTIKLGSATRLIGTSAFAMCDSLEVVDLRQCMQLASIQGFHDCESLRTVWWPAAIVGEITSGAFFNAVNLRVLDFSQCRVGRVGDAFMWCDNLSKVKHLVNESMTSGDEFLLSADAFFATPVREVLDRALRERTMGTDSNL